ncbi:MAG: OsmC family protein [Xanthobacteraceae bacterium]
MSTEMIRQALEKFGRVLAEAPEKARGKNASATASLRDGLAFQVSGPRGEVVQTDMPPAMGGAASAPGPGWLLRAALASCTGSVIAMRAASLGVTLDTLEVTVESESDNRGILGLDDKISAGLDELRTEVRIGAANVNPDQLREIVRWADEHSPVACTLREAPESRVDVAVV